MLLHGMQLAARAAGATHMTVGRLVGRASRARGLYYSLGSGALAGRTAHQAQDRRLRSLMIDS